MHASSLLQHVKYMPLVFSRGIVPVRWPEKCLKLSCRWPSAWSHKFRPATVNNTRTLLYLSHHITAQHTMMKTTIYVTFLALTLATSTASAERHHDSLRRRRAAHKRMIPKRVSEQERMDEAIQQAMLNNDEEDFNIAANEYLESREAGIQLTSPHAFENESEGIAKTSPYNGDSTEDLFEKRAEGIALTSPPNVEDSTDEMFTKRAEGIAKTSPFAAENEQAAIKSANESRSTGIVKTSPVQRQEEITRSSLGVSKRIETAVMA